MDWITFLRSVFPCVPLVESSDEDEASGDEALPGDDDDSEVSNGGFPEV